MYCRKDPNNFNELTIVAEATLKSFPPSRFTKEKSPPNSIATIVSDDDQLSNYPKCTNIKSVEDVELVRKQVCGRPLLLTVTCCKHVPQGQRLNSKGEYLSIKDKEWWLMTDNSPWMNPYANPVWGTGTTSLYGDKWIMPRFIVIVNTTHPNIRRQLEEGFERLQQLVARGENVALEFDFNPVILQWWKHQGPARYDQIECLTLTSSTGASLVITNRSPLSHRFDCHPAWCICWPLYCCIAVPYKLWRYVLNKVHDIVIKMEGRVEVAHPTSPGYALDSLFRPMTNQTQPGALGD